MTTEPVRDPNPAAIGAPSGDGTNRGDNGSFARDADPSRGGTREGAEAAVGGGEAIGAPGAVGGLDPARLFSALLDMADPVNVMRETGRMFKELTEIALGISEVEIPAKDKRFADPTWKENPFYRGIAQSYFAWSGAMDRLAAAPRIQGDWRRASQAAYTSTLITSALAPTNTLAGNPAALKRAFETGGASVAKGTATMVHDLLTNQGLPSQVDSRPFHVGENLAATPGAVVYREDMFEVIQYRPSTPNVRSRPLLMIPPQINKYYFLDLAPGKSFVEYLVGQGINYFTIVWRNPREEHGHWGLEDYVGAQLRAIDVVRDIAGSDDVNTLGACAGGLTNALMLGHLAAKGDDRVNATTFCIAMVDTGLPNVLSLMADESMQEKLARDAAQGKVYDHKAVSRNFAWMRPNDLVFNYVTNNWLLGNDPPAFDVLAWNNDSTNLVAKFDSDLLGIYSDNKAGRPDAIELLGTPIDLRAVECDNYVVAGLTDHITPWAPCYMTTQLLSGPSEVVVTSTGHIQTMVNPPGKPRARYFAGPERGPNPQEWLNSATKHEGSWWPRYAEWLVGRSGDELPAPKRLGSPAHPAGDPAPGTYVHE